MVTEKVIYCVEGLRPLGGCLSLSPVYCTVGSHIQTLVRSEVLNNASCHAIRTVVLGNCMATDVDLEEILATISSNSLISFTDCLFKEGKMRNMSLYSLYRAYRVWFLFFLIHLFIQTQNNFNTFFHFMLGLHKHTPILHNYVYYPPEVRRGKYWGLGVFNSCNTSLLSKCKKQCIIIA